MNRRHLFVGLLLVKTRFTIINIIARPSNLDRLCHSDSMTLCQDVVGNAQVDEPTTPFENLKRLSSHGQELYSYPALSYGAQKDMCMWQAFLDNKIQSEECSAALNKTRMENVTRVTGGVSGKEDVGDYYSDLQLSILILAFFLTYSYACHLFLFDYGLSRCTPPVLFGSLLVSVIYFSVAHPLVSLGDPRILLQFLITTNFIQLVVLTIIGVLMIKCFIPSEDEEEKQHYEDGYRKMGDDETPVLVYVAVPLQVV